MPGGCGSQEQQRREGWLPNPGALLITDCLRVAPSSSGDPERRLRLLPQGGWGSPSVARHLAYVRSQLQDSLCMIWDKLFTYRFLVLCGVIATNPRELEERLNELIFRSSEQCLQPLSTPRSDVIQQTPPAPGWLESAVSSGAWVMLWLCSHAGGPPWVAEGASGRFISPQHSSV